MSGVQILGGGVNPVGTIISYLGNNAPDGYLFCDGTEYNIGEYPALANHFETEFGTKNYFGGDGITTFKVPDLQGEFLRCTGTNSHANQGSGVNVGVHQDGTQIPWVYSGSNIATLPSNAPLKVDFDGTVASTKYISAGNTSTYTTNHKYYTARPTNTSVWYCIKF